jgi:sugar O-acyltransferase (sialic acid O-acetyltransferase NeuD family)
MENPVIIFGSGTLGKIAVDIFNDNNILVYGILDDKPELHNTEIGSVMVMGSTDDGGILKIIGNKTEAFIAVKNKVDRIRISNMLKERRKTVPINALHKSSIISEEAILGHGNLIGSLSSVGPFASLGNLNIIGSSVVIDVEASIGDFVEIGNGCIINSKAKIEEGVFIGSGVTIVSGVNIGKNARVGAGSVVLEDVPENTTVFGNPAKNIG